MAPKRLCTESFNIPHEKPSPLVEYDESDNETEHSSQESSTCKEKTPEIEHFPRKWKKKMRKRKKSKGNLKFPQREARNQNHLSFLLGFVLIWGGARK